MGVAFLLDTLYKSLFLSYAQSFTHTERERENSAQTVQRKTKERHEETQERPVRYWGRHLDDQAKRSPFAEAVADVRSPSSLPQK